MCAADKGSEEELRYNSSTGSEESDLEDSDLDCNLCGEEVVEDGDDSVPQVKKVSILLY